MEESNVLSANVIDYIESKKQLEVDGWIFKHRALSCQSGEVISIQAPTNERLFENRFEISVFWHPKDVVRNNSLQSLDPKKIRDFELEGEYSWAKEKSFGVVIKDLKTGEYESISENGESLSVSFIGDLVCKRAGFPELMNDKFDEGFDGSELECIKEVINDLKFYTPQYVTQPRALNDKALNALIKRKERDMGTGEWALGTSSSPHESLSF